MFNRLSLPCIRGHRSSTCNHSHRTLIRVRNRGRPSASEKRVAILPKEGNNVIVLKSRPTGTPLTDTEPSKISKKKTTCGCCKGSQIQRINAESEATTNTNVASCKSSKCACSTQVRKTKNNELITIEGAIDQKFVEVGKSGTRFLSDEELKQSEMNKKFYFISENPETGERKPISDDQRATDPTSLPNLESKDYIKLFCCCGSTDCDCANCEGCKYNLLLAKNIISRNRPVNEVFSTNSTNIQGEVKPDINENQNVGTLLPNSESIDPETTGLLNANHQSFIDLWSYQNPNSRNPISQQYKRGTEVLEILDTISATVLPSAHDPSGNVNTDVYYSNCDENGLKSHSKAFSTNQRSSNKSCCGKRKGNCSSQSSNNTYSNNLPNIADTGKTIETPLTQFSGKGNNDFDALLNRQNQSGVYTSSIEKNSNDLSNHFKCEKKEINVENLSSCCKINYNDIFNTSFGSSDVHNLNTNDGPSCFKLKNGLQKLALNDKSGNNTNDNVCDKNFNMTGDNNLNLFTSHDSATSENGNKTTKFNDLPVFPTYSSHVNEQQGQFQGKSDIMNELAFKYDDPKAPDFILPMNNITEEIEKSLNKELTELFNACEDNNSPMLSSNPALMSFAPSCVLPGECQCGDGCVCEGCVTHQKRGAPFINDNIITNSENFAEGANQFDIDFFGDSIRRESQLMFDLKDMKTATNGQKKSDDIFQTRPSSNL